MSNLDFIFKGLDEAVPEGNAAPAALPKTPSLDQLFGGLEAPTTTPVAAPTPVVQQAPLGAEAIFSQLDAPLDEPAPSAVPGGSLVRGMSRAGEAGMIGLYMTGALDEETLLNSMEWAEGVQGSFPRPIGMDDFEKKIGEAGFLETLGLYATNPNYLSSTLGETIGQSAPGMIAAPAGFLVGGPAGAIAGLGVGSGATEYGAAWKEYMQKQGKPQSRADWQALLQDKDLVNEAHWAAATKAGVVAAFDILGARVGGQLAGRYFTPGTTRLQKGVGIAQGLGVEAVTEGGGEFVGTGLGFGEWDPKQAAVEGVLSVLSSGPMDVAIRPIAERLTPAGASPLPEDIASAFDMLDPKKPQVPRQGVAASAVAEPGPVFYSQTIQIAQEKLPKSASAEQILATLRNSPGVKQEELEALEVEGFLSNYEGNVPKDELIAHLEESQVQVEETVRREVSTAPSWTRLERPPAGEELRSDGSKLIDVGSWWTGQGYTIRAAVEEEASPSDDGIVIRTRSDVFQLYDREQKIIGNYPSLEAAQGVVAEILGGSLATKYGNWTLPGGENYKELLLRLPTTERRETVRGVPRLIPDETFESPHWSEKNVLAHVRFDERIDRDGVRTLFLDEIQSDWHQQGREKGYQSERRRLHQRLVEAEKAGITARQQGFLREEQDLRDDAYLLANSEYNEAIRKGSAVVDAPFKSSWSELAIKRMIRYAADNGFERIAIAPGSVHVARWRQEGDTARGQAEFYDKALPSIAKKWAKRLGGTWGQTTIPSVVEVHQQGAIERYISAASSDEVARNAEQFGYPPPSALPAFYIDIPRRAATTVQKGLPLFSKKAETDNLTELQKEALRVTRDPESWRAAQAHPLYDDARRAYLALSALSRKMGVKHKINYYLISDAEMKYRGWISPHMRKGVPEYDIYINLFLHKQSQELWSTMTHELGHALVWELYSSASTSTQLSITAAYEEFLANVKPDDRLRALFAQRDNAVAYFMRRRDSGMDNTLSSMEGSERDYWIGFDEWFAEQVARWATTSEKPLSIVDKFFKKLADTLKGIYKAVHDSLAQLGFVPQQFDPNPYMKEWLDSFLTSSDTLAPYIVQAREDFTKKLNASALAEEAPFVRPTPYTASTVLPRIMLNKIFGGKVPPNVKAMAAHGDRMNRFHDIMLSLPQVAKLNTHIRQLQLYKEDVALSQLEKQNIMGEAVETLRAWRNLGLKQGDKLATFLDELHNMQYLPDDERDNGIQRKPTAQEFAWMVQRNGLNADAVKVVERILSDFDRHLTRYEEVLVSKAEEITALPAKIERLLQIKNQFEALRKVPYIPAMRFGDFSITIRNANKEVAYFSLFETEKAQRSAERELKTQLAPGQTISMGVMPKDAMVFVGVPKGMLDRMAEKLDLSPTQRTALEQLRFDLAPAQSFRHRFQHRKRTAGYSTDFQRSYANYFFHGSNHLVRVKYNEQLQQHVADVRETAKFMPDGVTRGKIANFMASHFRELMDPKPDFAKLRGIMFHWALGFNLASAALNMSQLLFGTYPYLAAKFGDLGAIREMGRSGANMSTYYKTGSYEGMNEPEMRAISEGIKEGVISEALAPELAGISESANLTDGFGGNAATRAWNTGTRWSAFAFGMAEQVNRRVTFRAAWRLAQANPNAKHVQETVRLNERQYERLLNSGWNPQDAAAFTVAKDAVEATQYTYAKWASPKFMRGHLRTLFMFKSFVQNTLFFAFASGGGVTARYMIVMAALGGLMGLPGAEDLEGVLEAIAFRLFGKDFNLKREMREYILNIADGKIPPDVILHGASRRGMGIPAVMDMLGGTVGVDIPFPTVDRSRAISLGQVSPVDVGKLFGPPSRDNSREIVEGVQQAAGIAFGFGFNLYKFLNTATSGSHALSDPKTWERVLPRAAANISKAYRAYNDDFTTANGARVVQFDVREPEHMAEVLAIAGGYSPLRVSAQWDRITAIREVKEYWDLKRNVLFQQMHAARRTADGDETQRVVQAIKRFNEQLPSEMKDKRITSDSLKRSLKMRERSRLLQEERLPSNKSDTGLYESMKRLFPESVIDVKKR